MKQNSRNQRTEIMGGGLLFLILWQGLYLITDNHMLPAPHESLAYLAGHFLLILSHCGASLLRMLGALVIALVIGLPLGMVMGRLEGLRKMMNPLLHFIYPIPKVAFLPLFMIFFGLGNLSKILLVVLILVFQIILSVRDGVMAIDDSYYQVIKVFRGKTKDIYRFVILPAVVARLLTSIRISIGIGLASLFFAENYATTYGIGYYILSAWTKMNYVEMFAGIFSLGLMGVILFALVDRLDHQLGWS